MTGKELDRAKKDGTLTRDEISCIEMINSCLIYGSDPYAKHRKWWYKKGYCERSYMDDYIELLGADRVNELVEGQKKSISEAHINVNVYTDCEGLSYNSISWADD